MNIFKIILIMLVFCPLAIKAQNTISFTIDKAVETALENNLQLKQQDIQIDINENNLFQSKLNFLPTANAGIGWGRSFGRLFAAGGAIDQKVNYDQSNPFIGFNLVVFDGLAKYYTMQSNKATILSNIYGKEKLANAVIQNVLALYVLLIFDEGNLKISKQRKDVLEKQLERLQKLFNAGALTQAELLNLQSQIASEEVNIVNLQNQFERDKLNLLQAMQVEIHQNYVFLSPDASTFVLDKDPLPSIVEIEENAITNMPEIKEQIMRIKATELTTKVIKGSLYPTISFSANLNSNYSTYRLIGEPKPYFTQLKDNFQQGINFNLSIPIFNGYQVRNRVQNNKLQEELARLNYKNTTDQLIRSVQQAYLDVTLSKGKYDAVKKQLLALEEAFKFAEAQYNAGTLNFYNYYETLNNKTKVQIELLQSQYDYFFKKKVLDVYQGKKLTF